MSRLLLAIICLFLIFIGASDLRSQDSHEVLLVARRTGLTELIDATTFNTVARLHFNFHVERLAANTDGSAIYVQGYGDGSCCDHYVLNLRTLKLSKSNSNDGNSGGTLLSPDGRWRAELRSFRGPVLTMVDVFTGAANKLTPPELPLTEQSCGGNWAAEGTWSGDHFYFYVACPHHPGFLWPVTPGITHLGVGTAVASFAEAAGCQNALPVEKALVAAGGKLFLYEPFGGKSDRTDACQIHLSGGARMVDSATGQLTRQIGAGFHFNKLIPNQTGSTLYGVDPGDAEWSGPIQLVGTVTAGRCDPG